MLQMNLVQLEHTSGRNVQRVILDRQLVDELAAQPEPGGKRP